MEDHDFQHFHETEVKMKFFMLFYFFEKKEVKFVIFYLQKQVPWVAVS